MKLSIIVPVYYNEETIKLMYEDLKKNVFNKVEDWELVLIDDGSGDNSWGIISELAESDNRIKAIKLSRNFGEHAAILAGLFNCTGDCAVEKAADMQEDSEIILRMLDSYIKGNKAVLAVRKDREEGIFQKMFAGMYYFIVRHFILKKMPKGGFDNFLIDRKVIETLRLLDEKNSSIILQILWAGFKTDKIYYIRRARKHGKSRWTFSKKFNLLMDSVTGFSFAPIRAISIIGTIFFMSSIIYGLYVVINTLLNGVDVAGWTSSFVLSLFSFGTIMITLGFLGEYIARTLEASRNRPTFIIDEVIEDVSQKELKERK